MYAKQETLSCALASLVLLCDTLCAFAQSYAIKQQHLYTLGRYSCKSNILKHKQQSADMRWSEKPQHIQSDEAAAAMNQSVQKCVLETTRLQDLLP